MSKCALAPAISIPSGDFGFNFTEACDGHRRLDFTLLPVIMTAPRSKGGLSLYDNLADPADTAATISSAPVSYIQNDGSIPEVAAASTTAKKPTDPSLRFQPIRRPQAKQVNKPKGFVAKATIPKPPPAGVVPQDAANAAPTPVAVKSKLADWAATEEDEWRYGTGEKRQRGGRRKNKKKREETLETDWDELYDPARPTNVEEYLRSDEKISEVREWKTLLYRHRKQYDESDISDDDEDEQPTFSSKIHKGIATLKLSLLIRYLLLRSIRSSPLI